VANVKITELTVTTDPASTDVLPIVDVTANTTKKVTIADLLENAGNGSASTPAFSFDADPDTGMYRVGADTLGFSTGGTQKLTIDSSGNVGVGTSSPEEVLHIAAASETVNSRDGVLLQSTSSLAADTGLPLVFTSHVGTVANYGVASIAGRKENATSGNAAGYLQFATGSSGGAISERLRIDSSGNVKIIGTGTSSAPNITLDSTGNASFGSSAAQRFRVVANASSTPALFLQNPNSTNYPFSVLSNGSATFAGSITAAGDLTVGGGASSSTTGAEVRAIGLIKASRPNANDALFAGYQNTNNQTSEIFANGNATFNGTVTAANITSDIRFKENIADANPQLADVVALGSQLKNWDWTDDAPLNTELRAKRFLGLVAQEAEKVCPDVAYSVPRTKQGAELTPEVVVPAVYETRIVPTVLDDEGEVIEAETTEQVLVTEEQVTPATYEELDDSYKAIKHDVLIMKLLGAVAELSAKVAALESA